MIVADASAIIEMLAEPAAHAVRRRVRRARSLHAPHLLDVEVTSGLHRLASTDAISPDRADDARADAGALPVKRYPHGPLLERAWELRANTTIYDGVYIALAELLGIPLVTCDERLARVPNHHAHVEVFSPR